MVILKVNVAFMLITN